MKNQLSISLKILFLYLILQALTLTACEFQANQVGEKDESSSSFPPGSETQPNPTPTPVTTPRPVPTPVRTPTSSVIPLWESKHIDGREWTAHVLNKLDTLGKDLLTVYPADYGTFCPGYERLSYSERKWFWTYLISAMVKYESGFKPESYYKESFFDNDGNPVISRGLLQISIESSRSYDCGFASESALHDPYQNLSCGIRILNYWMIRDRRVAGRIDSKWRGGARYWSVLRTASNSYLPIVTLTKSISICK